MVSIFLVLDLMVVPYLSKAYNFERLFQQSLIILGLPAVIGGLFLLKLLKNKVSLIILTLLFLFYFLYGSGILYPLVGGAPLLYTHNVGIEYNAHYVHAEEVASILWMEENYNSDRMLYADPYSELRIRAFSDIKRDIITFVFPSIIDRSAYVYSSYTNVIRGDGAIDDRSYFTREIADYNFPLRFLEENKNIVYSNGGSKLFK